MILKSEHCPWSVEVDGADLVVRNIVANTLSAAITTAAIMVSPESGLRTRGNLGLLGCALPIRSLEASTRLSPLAFKGPHFPWFIPVKVWREADGEDSALLLEKGLIDNGPDVLKYPTHALDLTVAGRRHFAPEIPLIKIADDFELSGLSYRIVGGAQWIS